MKAAGSHQLGSMVDSSTSGFTKTILHRTLKAKRMLGMRTPLRLLARQEPWEPWGAMQPFREVLLEALLEAGQQGSGLKHEICNVCNQCYYNDF